MNKQRRSAIDKVIEKLSDISTLVTEVTGAIEEIRDEEQDYFDNMPENFQYSDKGDAVEQTISYLEDSIESAYQIETQAEEAIQYLEDAKNQ